jgi:hypothetical protein
MDREEIMARLRERLNAPPDPPLEATRKFLQSYCLDSSMESLLAQVRYMAGVNTVTLRAGLAGIEGLLANPPAEEGVLRRLVECDAGKFLDDPTDAGARVWLEEIARILREELDRVSHGPGRAL